MKLPSSKHSLFSTPVGAGSIKSSEFPRVGVLASVLALSIACGGVGGDGADLPPSFDNSDPSARPGFSDNQQIAVQQAAAEAGGAQTQSDLNGEAQGSAQPQVNNSVENTNANAAFDNGQTTNQNEGNQSSGAGGAPASGQDAENGAAGGAMVGAAGGAMQPNTNQGEAAPGNNTPQPEPVAPSGTNVTEAELEEYFAALPCGAKYTALGDGGWQFCLRLADGGGACTQGGSAGFQRVTFNGGGAIREVAQVSGLRDGGVAVVTTGGALHVGTGTTVDPSPLIASGVVNFSGGYHGTAVLVEQGSGFEVLAWSDNGQPTSMPLPGGASPVQVSANYGLACALDTRGGVSCWDSGGNHGLPLTAAASTVDLGAPVRQISVGQNSVCGVTFDDRLVCEAAWYDSPYLPTEGAGADFNVRSTTFPSVAEMHSGFAQGVVVTTSGEAFYLPRVGAGQDNPGEQFEGVSNAIAAGGDRGNACVLTDTGAVFCRTGAGAATQANLDGAPLVAQVAACPL